MPARRRRRAARAARAHAHDRGARHQGGRAGRRVPRAALPRSARATASCPVNPKLDDGARRARRRRGSPDSRDALRPDRRVPRARASAGPRGRDPRARLAAALRLVPAGHPRRRVRRAPRGRGHRGRAGPLPDGRAPAPVRAGRRDRHERTRRRIVYSSQQGRMCPRCGAPDRAVQLHARIRARRARRRRRARAPRDEGAQRQDRSRRSRASASPTTRCASSRAS